MSVSIGGVVGSFAMTSIGIVTESRKKCFKDVGFMNTLLVGIRKRKNGNKMRCFRQVVCGLCAISSALAEPPPDYLSFATGVYNLLQDRWRTWELDIEYKFHVKWLPQPNPHLVFRPLVGALATMRGTVYVYLGINFDILLGKYIVLSPGFAAGYFNKGQGRDLGYPLEFRSGVELAWIFPDLSRLGVHFYHLSNASIGRRNPGEESLVLFYDIPLVKGFPFGTDASK